MGADKIGMKDIRKILVVNLGGIGDLLLSTPALKAIKEAHKDGSLSVLTGEGPAVLLKRLPYIDKVYTIHPGRPATAAFKENIRLILELRKERFDIAVNMRTLVSVPGAVKIRMLLGFIGAKLAAGRDTDGRGSFLDISIGENSLGDRYEMEYDIELAEALGSKVTDRRPDLPINSDDRSQAARVLSDGGVGQGDIVIGIHPGGKPSHRWPVENFAAVVSGLSKKTKGIFVITGEASERDLAGRLGRPAGVRTIDATGRLDIFGLSALIERCDVYVTNDTANMHIAAALGVGLVAIFGPGYLKRFDPRYLSDKASVLSGAAACSPCDKVRCDSMRCMETVSQEDVQEAVLKLLKERGRIVA